MSKENMEKINIESLSIDLSDRQIEEIQLFLSEGSRGISDFGASCGNIIHCGTNSCVSTPAPTSVPEISFHVE
jgi:hypothetical protein